jgi:hypothetical protein
MKANEWNMYSPDLVCVCVNSVEKDEYSGVLWHQYEDRPVAFQGTWQLIQIMEDLYDSLDFPQCSTAARSFIKKKMSDHRIGKKEAMTMDSKRIQDKSGDLGTFVIHVKYRQNATWQGEVVWAEKKQKQCFRSALELIKMIDGALESEKIKEET